LLLALCALATATGCGYTVLKGSAGDPTATPPARTARPSEGDGELPPGHPPIERGADWLGMSFLDRYIGIDEPLRFENIRRLPDAAAPTRGAIITFRITVGGPTLAEIWQIRMDTFGWVNAAHWQQGSTGPELDEHLAHDRASFRLERESEAALRRMAILLLPQREQPVRLNWPDAFPRAPRSFYAFEDPGRIEIEYRIETIDRVDPETWPGGRVSAPLELVQLLIGTWDDVPPREIRDAAEQLLERYPTLVDIALLAEGIVLAWEVEGAEAEPIGLPLRVGR